MTSPNLIEDVLSATPATVPSPVRLAAILTAVTALIGLVLSFATGGMSAGLAAVLVCAVLTIGYGIVGILISAIFELTNAKWGRAYRRLAEAGIVFMPLGLLLLAIYMIGTAVSAEGLPWMHHEHLSGGKHLWLMRGFWDLRIIAYLFLSYGLALRFLYFSLLRDFTIPGVAERMPDSFISRRLTGHITDPQETRTRCESRLKVLAPAVAIVYAVAFSFIGIDLIMALEPDWFSTLFGGWYFIGNLFSGLALLAIAAMSLRNRCGLQRFLPEARQSDLATLLFAFCLLNVDFFWSQYLTIWYGNLPEETGWLIERTVDESLPWADLSWVSLGAFFVVPFIALLFRRVKRNRVLLTIVALVVVAGIFLARFIEIAPALVHVEPGTALWGGGGPLGLLLASILLFIGCLGVGGFCYYRLLTKVPILPIGDDIFVRECGSEEHAS
jgi:hypothetical protein